MTQSSTNNELAKGFVRRDIRQQVTDTIIQQLEAGTIPWQKPWTGDDSPIFALPKNSTTGKKYKGINILLLWSAATNKHFTSPEWATFKQWQENKEVIRKGEHGSMIIYYDTLEKEVEDEIRKIPFIKSSVVFNRQQLASYNPDEKAFAENRKSLVERIEHVDMFITNTKALIKHEDNLGACYMHSTDTIYMPEAASFIETEGCSATENYYGTLFHELSHWTGAYTRLKRTFGRKFGDKNYAEEELTAEIGAAFLCAEHEICTAPKPNNAAYIAHWLRVLKEDKQCIFTAASEASKAVNYLELLQP